MSQNIRSICKHIDEFYYDVDDLKFDVIALCETWLSAKVERNYKHFHQKSRNSHGGGVGLHVRKVFDTKSVDELTMIDSNIESIFIKLKYRSSHLLVASI